MALDQIPVPRSRAQITGDMIDTFLSKYGLRALKVGSPVLSMLETASASDLRSSEDIFTFLNAKNLDNLEGDALDREGADEDLPRITEAPASTRVTVGDSSITKASTAIFQGTSAPIAGTTALNVAANVFPSAPFDVYLGRGTTNYEGPITVSSVTNNVTYYTLNLASGTQKFHNVGETVVLSQGGDRAVPAGSTVQTGQGAGLEKVQYKTLYAATVPDGEDEISGVLVVAIKPGIGGNQAQTDAISEFTSPPFTGATVTSPLPITNGVAKELDDVYRERIRSVRASRSKGTPLAIKTSALGVTATDENKRVQSASLVTRSGQATLYIDDGTGYEEVTEGISIEPVTDYALGGETDFRIVQSRPISKAYVETTIEGPYTLAAGYTLAFDVGGTVTEHSFSADEAASISNTTPDELVAAINGDPNLLWGARTTTGGTKVAFFSKGETNEDIQCVDPTGGETNANTVLGCTTNRVYTAWLYQNDQLLFKDGQLAQLTSNPFSNWATLVSGETLIIKIDNTPAQTITITDEDFIDADTGYTTVSANSLEAWATVLESLVAGCSFTVASGVITATSNKGRNSRAKIEITGGTLVSKNMWEVDSSTGRTSDYTLDRNTGDFTVATMLSAGDRLSFGTLYTRAFTESEEVTAAELAADGNLWFSIDGGAEIITHGVTGSTALDITETSPSWGKRVRITSATATALFTNVEVGDWVVFWDTELVAIGLQGAYRVCTIDAGSTWFEIEDSTGGFTSAGVLLEQTGITFVRSEDQLQRMTITSGTYAAANFVTALADLKGATARTYRTTKMRVTTNTFSDDNGDIALVAADTNGQLVALPVDDATPNLTGHVASVESDNSDLGTPSFSQNIVTSAANATTPTVDSTETLGSRDSIVGLRALDDSTASTGRRFSTNYNFNAQTLYNTGSGPFVLHTDTSVLHDWLSDDRVYFASPFVLASSDTMAIVVDDDVSKRYNVNMWRKIKPTISTYGTANTFKDADNANASLVTAFGDDFDFVNFAVHMASRCATHQLGDNTHYPIAIANLTKAILWRSARLGPDGNSMAVRYVYPEEENSAVSQAVDNDTDQNTYVDIVLASGALKTGASLQANSKVGVVVASSSGDFTAVRFCLGLRIGSVQRDASGNVTVNLDIAASDATNHNIPNGQSVYLRFGGVGGLVDGQYTITSVPSVSSIIVNDGTASSIGFTLTNGSLTRGTAEQTLTGLSPAAATGDYFRWLDTTGIPTEFQELTMAGTFPNPQTIVAYAPVGYTPNTVISWVELSDINGLVIFAAADQTASTIAAAVNALEPAVINGTILGNGTGIIKYSSMDEGLYADAWFFMTDGVNYIRSQSVGADYTFTFKNDITALLATNSDWLNEDIRLVPQTAKNVSDWFNALCVTGLSSVAEVVNSSRAHKLQFASNTAGSVGAIQVQGGLANSASASVLDSAVAISSTHSLCNISSALAAGFVGGAWVSVDNTEALPRTGIIDSATHLTSIATDGTFVLNSGGTPVWSNAGSSSKTASNVMMIEKQGKFVCYSDGALGTPLSSVGVKEGDYVRITAPASVAFTSEINDLNTGIYRIVRIVMEADAIDPATSGCFWIENTNAVEENAAECDIQFLAASSMLPGDTLLISTSLWGADNMGTWTVTSVGDAGSGEYLNRFTFQVDVSDGATTTQGAAAALGTQSNLVNVIENEPARFIKRIQSIVANTDDEDMAEVKFDTMEGYGSITSTAGSVVTALDKLGFPTDISKGIDGYRHTIGLIGEVNRVIEGDEKDPASYPGVKAAGSNINYAGPYKRRMTFSYILRAPATAAVKNKARAVIASEVNKTPMGGRISFSYLLGQLEKIPTVEAVVQLYPPYDAGHDSLALQQYEKPLILDLENDITISFVGQ